MYKRIFIIILLITVYFDSKACDCLLDDNEDLFLYYKRISHRTFVGKVIDIKKNDNYYTYNFQVIDRLSSSFSGTVQVKARPFVSACGIQFHMGDMIALAPDKHKGDYWTELCGFNISVSSESFSRDTMIMRLMSKSNFRVNCSLFKGVVKNGKRQGEWTDFYGTGMYRKGRKVGLWKNETDSGHYHLNKKKGWWLQKGDSFYYSGSLKNIDMYTSYILYNDSVRILHTPKKDETFYKSGELFQCLNKQNYLVFYKNGSLKEKALLNKTGFIKEWLFYDSYGTIKAKTTFDEPIYDSDLIFVQRTLNPMAYQQDTYQTLLEKLQKLEHEQD